MSNKNALGQGFNNNFDMLKPSQRITVMYMESNLGFAHVFLG